MFEEEGELILWQQIEQFILWHTSRLAEVLAGRVVDTCNVDDALDSHCIVP